MVYDYTINIIVYFCHSDGISGGWNDSIKCCCVSITYFWVFNK